MPGNEEFLRLLSSLQMEKGVDRELLLDGVETALVAAARKKFPDIEELRIRISRDTGDIVLLDGDRPLKTLDPAIFGRIAAQTAKQIIIQRIREAESDVVFGNYREKEGTVVVGSVQRVERGAVVVNIGNIEALVPRNEQVPAENYKPGERLRCYVTSVRKRGNRVQITLSRTHPNLVREMFEMEVPEIFDHVVEIKGIVREPGYRTKLAVTCPDSRVDPVGACVGVKGSRIRNIVDELGGEKIDIVRWNDNIEMFIRNALAPAEIQAIEFDARRNRARVIVDDEQLSLAIGRKGQNVRLSSKLTGWDLSVMTVDQHSEWRALGREEIAALPEINDEIANNLTMNGFECFQDIVESGTGELAKIAGISGKDADKIYKFAVAGYQQRLVDDRMRKTHAAEKKKEALEMQSMVNNLDPEIIAEVQETAAVEAETVSEPAAEAAG
ncbi:transcription termination/antitermination protein NusA [Planctomycetales bacterium]|nr:transcription termination/antitermination protein NusA [Planctomycetales bacterium]GHV23819.1 transcription termination/antitermination protein NusA [Planctomycetales bacterium]